MRLKLRHTGPDTRLLPARGAGLSARCSESGLERSWRWKEECVGGGTRGFTVSVGWAHALRAPATWSAAAFGDGLVRTPQTERRVRATAPRGSAVLEVETQKGGHGSTRPGTRLSSRRRQRRPFWDVKIRRQEWHSPGAFLWDPETKRKKKKKEFAKLSGLDARGRGYHQLRRLRSSREK